MNTKLSKKMSFALRHNPEAFSLTLSRSGWVPLTEFAAALAVTPEEVFEVVETDPKGRFTLNAEGLIRANQGHTVAVDLELAELAPPEVLFHGTVARFLPAIMEEGLKKGQRHAVHLSAAREGAIEVGARRGEPTVLSVASGRMSREGFTFFRSENGVWLTDAVPPEFIS